MDFKECQQLINTQIEIWSALEEVISSYINDEVNKEREGGNFQNMMIKNSQNIKNGERDK
ncbi:MAG TPA: hypothetical protein PLZ32_09400 [Saprospiraceae bacterium]|nr:hypothetical protein [Saprospiraceae bacterium]